MLSPVPTLALMSGSRNDAEAAPSARYAALFRAHYGRVVRLLSVLGVAPGELDDVAQEVFIIAHRKLDQLRPDASAAAWLLAITRNVAATVRRSRVRARAREDKAPVPEPAADPEAAAMKSEAARLLQGFVATLPEEQRLVFVLYEIEGESATEVAETLQIPRNTVHSRIRLIREKLARTVARHQSKEARTNG